MSKRFMKQLVTATAAICMILVMMLPINVSAEGTSDPTDGILQVMLAYVDDGGERTYYTSGTCFLINEEYVLTNQHIFNLDEEYVKLASGESVSLREAIMIGENLSELNNNDRHLKLFVFANRDMSVEAVAHENAKSEAMDFAVLRLSEKIYDRKPLAMGDSSAVKQQDTVYALGFPADSIEDKAFNTKSDVSIVNGIVSKVTTRDKADVFEHTAPLNLGNSGGPLLNENNEVIGINTFVVSINNLTTKNYTIQINPIKEALNTFGITYTSPDSPAGPTTDPNQGTALTVADLQSKIDSAKALSMDSYTDESAQAFQNAISSAEMVASGNPTPEQIEAAISDLNNAQSSLKQKETEAPVEEKEESKGPSMIVIGIIVAVVAVVLIVVIIIIASSSGKKKKKAENRGGNGGYTPQRPPVAPAAPPVTPVAPPVAPPMMDEGSADTTLLNAGAGETTLLSGAGGSAYLIRKKSGERININSQNFSIGKERRRVSYCISDNSSVSRLHLIILKKGGDYFAVDQRSSNFSYINGIQLEPLKETLLTDRSVLKLSDEEFEFHMS